MNTVAHPALPSFNPLDVAPPGARYLLQTENRRLGAIVALSMGVSYELAGLLGWTDPGVLLARSLLTDAAGFLGPAAGFVPVLAVVATLIVVGWRDSRPLPALKLSGLSLVEGLAFGGVFGLLGFLLTLLVGNGAGDVPFLAGVLGAPVYEETIFRVLGLAGLAWLLERVGGLSAKPAGLIALFASSAAFAAAHGLMGGLGLGQAVVLGLGGLLLGGLFMVRGLAVTVMAHAGYNSVLILTTAGGSVG